MDAIRPSGPNDPKPIGSIGNIPAGPSGVGGSFQMPEKPVGAASAPAPTSPSVDPMLRRLKERLSSGISPDGALNEIVEDEITQATGSKPSRQMVDWVSDAVRNDPELSRLFGRVARSAQS